MVRGGGAALLKAEPFPVMGTRAASLLLRRLAAGAGGVEQGIMQSCMHARGGKEEKAESQMPEE